MRRGVTLVELIVVVVILVILVAVMLPLAKYAIEEGRLREGARQFNAYFASARARAQSTGRPAGVWLEIEQPTPGLFQCSQLFAADVPAPYSGDVSDAVCLVRQAGPPWQIDFQTSGAMMPTLVAVGDSFQIQLDYKGTWYRGQRTAAGFQIIGPRPGNRPAWFGPDKAPGNIGVDDDGNGKIDDFLEWGLGDDGPRSIYAKYKIRRQPARVGQSLELPQGIVIDPGYSGAGPAGNEFAAARGRVLVMFNPQGGVASASYIDQAGNLVEDTGTSKLHFLIGRTEQCELPWQNVAASNIVDGGNYWVTVNRRTGSVGTVENTPNVSMPIGTAAERAAYLSTAREFATSGETVGGQ
jgi:prepilin-type N-terminal cleavage/methylation domain-containing protein